MHYYKNKSSLKKHSFASFSPLKVFANIVIALANNLKLHLYAYSISQKDNLALSLQKKCNA